jgi:IS30 family transposase
MAKNKHLTNDERLKIEHLLGEQKTLKEIAAKLDKHPTTISREIRARVIVSEQGARYRVRNRCVRRADCNRNNLCEDKSQCTRSCPACNLCNEICPDFVEQVCGKLFESPYCCNGCLDEYQCVLRKKFYINKKAHEAYRETLIESRVGANITEGELLALDEMVSPLIMRGQSVHHIVTSNPDDFNVSEKSIYRYVDGGLLTARNIDMPRVCRMKPRKTKPVVHKVDGSCRIGRTYTDYEAFIKENPLPVVEMDSVIGRAGGKALLTLMFTSCDFMLAFIRERNTSQSVIDVFDMLYELLGASTFSAMFPLLLADNGSEFSNPQKLEFDCNGVRRSRVFYCDPYAAFQKPHVELNHEFVRRILPKGKSFDNFDQDHINLMMSHINSYSREKLGNKSPLDLFGFIYGFDVLDKLQLKKIPPVEIMLKPALLK